MNSTDGIVVLSDEPLLGPAAFVQEHKTESEGALAQALREHALTQEVGLSAARSPIDAFARIVRRIRGRTLVEDLGTHEVAVTWLSSHVPPGGSAHLKVAQLAKSQFGLKLGVVGIGLGSGRNLTLGIDQDFGQRDKCMLIQYKFRVAVSAYRYDKEDDEPQTQIDVVQPLGEKTTTFDKCPYCFLEEGDCPDMAEPIEGDTYDLTNDAKGKTENLTIVIESDKEAEVGLKLPVGGIEITPSLAVKRNATLSCTLESQFLGGYVYTPHRLVTDWDDLPFWGRIGL